MKGFGIRQSSNFCFYISLWSLPRKPEPNPVVSMLAFRVEVSPYRNVNILHILFVPHACHMLESMGFVQGLTAMPLRTTFLYISLYQNSRTRLEKIFMLLTKSCSILPK